jgi:hypothetical protein
MGWLSEEVERQIAAWFRDHYFGDTDSAQLARRVMQRRRSSLDGDQMTNLLSIRDLLDKVEGDNSHLLMVTEKEWKMTHPLTCRMAGLIWCTVAPAEGLAPGTYALREERWELVV